ncbi:MAG: YkgJ family cysteine cluster protein [Euryarchaeota archaeon]|nr:YkgJ family cysteine cluster protein [Euryarchaeota archaeon]MBU4222296.1 YkgJ family cysteine cluster protein [Euryarchaeota archaeon]MCG2735415.1 YkgJ family cysteine cluster protein [Candidatus Methanoperedenaceae archaeon]
MGNECDIKICGSLCCRNCPVLTEDEALTLIKNVKKEYGLELELKKYFRKAEGEHGHYYAVKMIKGQCIFLDKEKRCRIYRCRPTLCELYPVIDVDAVDVRCPDVGKNKFSQEMLDSLKKRYADEVDERIRKEHTFRFI